MTEGVYRTSVVSRRHVVLGVSGLIGGVALGLGLTPPAPASAGSTQAPDRPGAQEWPRRHSANGWPVIDTAPQHAIEGSNATVSLLAGDVATVLLHVARRFAYEVHDYAPAVPGGPNDVVGHTTARMVAAEFESNHLSGTAVSLRPALYPIGATGGFFPGELIVLRDVLADCEGVVRWGGDLDPVKESHFQIDVPPGNALLARVAAKIRGWDASPELGAGATDPLAPGRRSAARALERVQAA